MINNTIPDESRPSIDAFQNSSFSGKAPITEKLKLIVELVCCNILVSRSIISDRL